MEFIFFIILVIVVNIIARKTICKMPNPGERLYNEEHRDEYSLYHKEK